MAGWTKMPLGTEVGLGPGNFVFDGHPTPPEKKRHSPRPIFGPRLLWPNGWMNQDATWYGGGKHRPICDVLLDGVPAPHKRGTAPQFSVRVYCGQTAAWMKMPLGTK